VRNVFDLSSIARTGCGEYLVFEPASLLVRKPLVTLSSFKVTGGFIFARAVNLLPTYPIYLQISKLGIQEHR
jgi:hypothetical protein